MATVTSENQTVDHPILTEKRLQLTIKREDSLHPFISGNKFRKLKYQLIAAKEQAMPTLLTFGGAYSNHIAATAYAAEREGLQSIGIIRGHELHDQWEDNPTLRFAYRHGMRFQFVTRAKYREKANVTFLAELRDIHGPFYHIPEGGTSALAVKGCEEILTAKDASFSTICTCVGTGGTIAGLINSAGPGQHVLGFPALKGDFLKDDIRNFVKNDNWSLRTDYHFGGYAKVDKELIHFINDFRQRTGIPLDPIYTGKMLYGILDLAQKDFFAPQSRILAIHTGGLQGIEGMNRRLKKRQWPQLEV